MWLLIILAIVPVIYFYMTLTHNYWKKRGIPYFKPIPLFGNLKPMVMLEENPGFFLGRLHLAKEALKEKFMGMFLFNSEPAILLRDPELIKHVFVKDFPHFANRNLNCDPHIDPMGHNNIFALRDEKWKYARQKISPAFTSGKMKQMFHLIMEVADELMNHIDRSIERKENELEVRELTGKYTTDVISTTAFGIKSNSLNDSNSVFRAFGRNFFTMDVRRATEVRSIFFMHSLAKWIRAGLFREESAQFFRKVFWDAISTRESQNIKRNDILDTLIALKRDSIKRREENPDKELFEFDGDALVSQSVLFFAAGFETTSSTISYTLFELAFAPEIQEKLRQEIKQNLKENDGKLTYDGLFDMKYLDRVVSETLRKYPPMPFIDRLCTADYKVPDSDLIIKKGTPLFVGLYKGLHYDPLYWEDPETFDPERFTEANKAKRHPFAYLPFGEGPHICIGMRFGLMNVKTSLSRILLKYRIEPTSGLKMPFELDHSAILISVKGGLVLKFVPIDEQC